MITLCDDIIICIMEKLTYSELLMFTLSCKHFMSMQCCNYFLKRKDKFHNPNKKFLILESRYPGFRIFWTNIYIKQINIGYVRECNIGLPYIGSLCSNFLDSLCYPKNIDFPFEFLEPVWNKIKYRFEGLNIKKLEFDHIHDQLEFDHAYRGILVAESQDKDYLINQIKLLYYVFKYFKNEILDSENRKKISNIP